MLTDSKKNISITYNYLDLPDTVKQGSSKLVFTYDAAGNKLYKQLITSGTVVSQKHYIEDAEVIATTSLAYDGKIESVAMGEGRIVNTPSGYKYEYQLQDHLYNNRVAFRVKSDGTADLTQVQNYYPFGQDMGDTTMNYTVAPNNLYKYSGKELQTELNLDSYDFGARHYDPRLGRWMQMDPLAIKFENQSPYNYVGNDPLNMVDPDGMQYYSGNLPLPYAPTSSATGSVAGAASTGGSATAGIIGGAIQLGLQFWKNPFAEQTKTIENFSTLRNLQGNTISSATPQMKSPVKATTFPLTHSQELAKYGKIIAAGSITIQASVGYGDAVEAGEVQTDKGWHVPYKTYYRSAIGVPALNANMLAIFSKDATISDWAGSYAGISAGWGFGSLEVGKSTSYKVVGVGLGPSWTPKNFKSISGGFTLGKTVLGRPFYKPYPHGNTLNLNSYISELIGL